ncbi:CoA-binding protein [Flavobacteriaceae bacterium S356]|uniref:CoA-binding protein n=1 Tax=Asprobacillus argus TaxID=3076534 RepID=A0ABU3LGZ6_9FLAO|nr:CoA-binding protein [Flavobacteriaceae bacterium S356]
MKNVTLVFGASLKEDRYSNIAINRLRDKELKVMAYGLREGVVADVEIDTELVHYDDIDTVTLYLNPKRQKEYYSYILNLQPRRVIFNPGTENNEFQQLLVENGIIAEVACTLVLLSINQY